MNKIYYFFKLFFNLFIKPKKELKICPSIKPYLHDKNMKLFELIEGFVVADLYIPAGSLTDGASIPPVFWSLLGHPFSPPFIAYAIAHDYMYQNAITIYKHNYKQGMKKFAFADRWLYLNMRKQNRKIVAWLFYVGVRCYSLLKFGIYKKITKGD